MDIGMPSTLRYAETTEEREMLSVGGAEVFSVYIQEIRKHLLGMSANTPVEEMKDYCRKSIWGWLKTNTEEFIGDHYVPFIRCRQIDNFVKRQVALDVLRNASRLIADLAGLKSNTDTDLAQLINSDRSPVSLAISDPDLSD